MIDNKKSNNLLIKKILKRFFGFGIFFLLFFGANNNYIYADGENTAQTDSITKTTTTTENTLDKSLQETKSLLDIVLKIIYMLSRPLLVIAGNAMDNSLVYGSLFHLDAPLWKFRNIMKNFANYALGFILLYNILKTLFNRKGGGFKDTLGIAKKILIAGILIQASRFLLSAVIDISTIATYAIGGMPLTILKNSDIGDQKILGVNSTMNLSDLKDASKGIQDDTIIYRTYGNNPEHKIASCKIISGGNSDYIVGKERNFITSGSDITGQILLEKGTCVLWGIPYRFNEFPELNGTQTNDDYKKIIDEKTTSATDLSGFETCGFVIPLFAQLKYDPDKCDQSLSQGTKLLLKEEFGSEGGSGRLNSIQGGTTLSTLIDKSKGFVGPLITIYSSTLNFGQIASSDGGGDSLTFGIVLKFFIKAFIGIMLVLPILALAVIMLARIGILWLVIAFTPIIIINQVFEFKIFENMDYLKTENIIRLIFAPVFIVFALSIALIFMSTLSGILTQNKTDFANPDFKTQKESTLEGLGITQPKPECYTILGTSTFCTKLNIGGGLDNISYFLINIFGIAIMWILLFRAIKQTGNIGEKLGDKLKKFGETTAGNIPIVPIGGGQFVGASNIAGSSGLISKIGDSIGSQMGKDNMKKLEERFPLIYKEPEENKSSKKSPTISADQVNKIITEAQKGTKMSDEDIKKLIGEEAAKKINGSITERIKQPENAKLLFAEFNKLPTTEQPKVEKAFEGLLDVKAISDYRNNMPTKDVATIITDLNTKKLEALVSVELNKELEFTVGGVKKKYKINKKSDGTYESTPV